MSVCKYCGAKLTFVATPGGGSMPCEAERTKVWPMPIGRQTALTEGGEVIRCELRPAGTHQGIMAYRPHWAACRGAEAARKGKRRSADLEGQTDLWEAME